MGFGAPFGLIALFFTFDIIFARTPVITPINSPLEPGTTIVLPLGASLPAASPIPPSLRAGGSGSGKKQPAVGVAGSASLL